MTASPDLLARLDLIVAADAAKSVPSGLTLTDGTRRETCAEGWWHDALWGLVFEDDLRSRGAEPETLRAAALAGDLDGLPGLAPHAGVARHLDLVRLARRTFQALLAVSLSPTDRDALRGDLTTGEAAELADGWPEAHAHASALLDHRPPASSPDFRRRLAFLMEADLLKSVTRATPLCDGSRRERSGEHSWHVALMARLLHDTSARPVTCERAVDMLLIHDLVEIDAGDVPIHGVHDAAAQERAEEKAARRLYGLLPPAQGRRLRQLWRDFEAASTPEAVFAKAIDRVQPVICNLEAGGGSWRDYDVTFAQLEARVAGKVRLGAPAVWEALRPRIEDWFAKA